MVIGCTPYFYMCFLYNLRKFSSELMKIQQRKNGKSHQETIFTYIFPSIYSYFAEKGEKNGIKFVKLHKNHFQNRIQVV